jgi:uncharacterized protein (DUF302 family)
MKRKNQSKNNRMKGNSIMINYGFTKELDISFEDVLKQVTENLKKAGFGVLTSIDVKEKFKEKLGIDFKKYVILGACNPANAYKAIEAEKNIGLMLPCNVIIYETDDKVVIAAIKPTVAMQMIGNEKLKKIAADVEIKIKQVIKSIQ